MICCCSLAGSSACKNCNRYQEYFKEQNMHVTVGAEAIYEQFIRLENSVKRLNERIDEILGGKE